MSDMADELDKKKVIIIEDDPELIEEEERRLRERGYMPKVVRRTRNLVKLLKDEKPKVMILDLALTDADGIALLREVKDDWQAKKTRVIVTSAYPSRVNYWARDKVEDIFVKPFDMESLVQSVDRVSALPED
jgi:two-component system alkaline phosphatase synthesis response regulator PhoP